MVSVPCSASPIGLPVFDTGRTRLHSAENALDAGQVTRMLSPGWISWARSPLTVSHTGLSSLLPTVTLASRPPLAAVNAKMPMLAATTAGIAQRAALPFPRAAFCPP